LSFAAPANFVASCNAVSNPASLAYAQYQRLLITDHIPMHNVNNSGQLRLALLCASHRDDSEAELNDFLSCMKFHFCF